MDVIFLVILFNLVQNADLFDYCTIPCGKTKHTICEYGCPAPKSSCSPSTETLTPKFRQSMLDAHNKFRSQVALGQLENFESASDMNSVSYEMELEYIAFCWLAKVAKMQHDKCRITKNFKSVGQNACIAGSYSPCMPMWFGEYKFFNGDKDLIKQVMEKFTSAAPNGIGHFTQVIWARTTHIGCGYLKCGKQHIVICNYGPAGNIMGGNIYKAGPTGSNCGTKPVKDGLCGEVVKPPEFDIPGLNKVGFLHNNTIFKSILLLLFYLISLYLI